jgi:oligopeptide/dipeptide ABC transporter ATP-binding protein
VNNGGSHSQNAPLLEIQDLQTSFFTNAGVVKAVNGVDLQVYKGEVFGLVGESGCGKSVTGLSILRLVDRPGRIVSGRILFEGESLLDRQEKEMVKLRGKRISMIFQQPLSSINPVFSLGYQIAQTLKAHQRLDQTGIRDRAVDLMRQVGIADPEERIKSYPHEISGGQAQRVMIAMAIALNPALLIADEPTTALDVTIQPQILDLIRELIREYGTTVILVTHDLGVIAEMAERVAVMYAGHIVEQADVIELFDRPLHPYTQGLVASVPVLGERRPRLETIPGTVPNLIGLPEHCRFASRCRARLKHNLDICTQQEPPMIEVAAKHPVRCWLYHPGTGHEPPLQIS